MNLLGRTDLSFHGDDVGRFLPWIIAFMVLLASFAIAGGFALNGVARNWDRGISDTMTIQLPTENDGNSANRLSKEAISALKKVAGVKTVRVIGAAEIRQQLEPWLGTAVRSDDLPLPVVLEVTVDRQKGTTGERLRQALSQISPDAAVDDHRVWLEGILDAIHFTEWVAVIVIILIAGATVGTVIFTTRAGIGLQREAIEVLHLVGAQDTYVARQFSRRALSLGLRGGAIGLVFAAPSLVLLDFLLQQIEVGLLPDLSLGIVGWLSILLLLPLVTFVAMITARQTVLKTLTDVV